MKKILFLLVVTLASNLVFSQSFDELEDLDAVSSFVMTKDAFELISKFPEAKSESLEFFNVLKGLNELKVFSSENTNAVVKMEAMVNDAVKNSSLIQLMRVKDKDSRIRIYVKSTANKDLVNEVLMFQKETNSKGQIKISIISLIGEINVNKLSKIANKYSEKGEIKIK
ncbi:DUF4252 domain-containing protein [Tenacibaculum sp. C7A-26P2]|uniref:DUF4252 domain-containing protein n=1 Tax=Tenacibaculum sp. C7A-26P2 TaxID=3447504 RepID=UPI003F843D7D